MEHYHIGTRIDKDTVSTICWCGWVSPLFPSQLEAMVSLAIHLAEQGV